MSFGDWALLAGCIAYLVIYFGILLQKPVRRVLRPITRRREYRRKVREAEAIRDECHASSGCSLYFFQDAEDQALVICETHSTVRALMTQSDAYYWRTVFQNRVAQGKGRYL
jgi:hypothetical protein